MSRHSFFSRIAIAAAVAVGLYGAQNPIQAQSGPSLVDQNLQVRVVASGLVQPTTLAFIGANDLLVLEKASGRVVLNAVSWASRCIRISRPRRMSSVLDGKHDSFG